MQTKSTKRRSPRPRVSRICAQCGESFTVTPSTLERSPALYCKRACADKSRRTTVAERLWCKVDTDGPTPSHAPTLGPCWIWTAHLLPNGYGQITIDGIARFAHRVAYAIIYGPIPDDRFVLHRCDNPACVRPSHLFLGTHNENMRDMRRKGRSAKGEQHSQAVLTAEQVVSIIHRKHAGETIKTLAATFRCGTSTIERIIYGKTWTHITAPTLASLRQSPPATSTHGPNGNR